MDFAAFPPLFLLVELPEPLLAVEPELPADAREVPDDELFADPLSPDFVEPDLGLADEPDCLEAVFDFEGVDLVAAVFAVAPALFDVPDLDPPDPAAPDFEAVDRDEPELEVAELDRLVATELFWDLAVPFEPDAAAPFLLPVVTPAVLTTAVAVPTAAPLAAPSAAP